MADISSIILPGDSTEYDIKDATARTDVATKLGNLDVYGRGIAIASNSNIQALAPGRYYAVTNLTGLTGIPSELAGTAFNVEVYNTFSNSTATSNQRRKIIIHGASLSNDGKIYTCLRTSDGWQSWHVFEGTVVT